MPQPQSLKTHWLFWLFSSTLLTALPFFVYGEHVLQKDGIINFLLIAFILQLLASIRLACGIANRRQFGVGGIIGLSVAFMMGSVALGCGILFIACASIPIQLGFLSSPSYFLSCQFP
jgi:hypothetical protein